MIKFQKVDLDFDNIKKTDIFICAVGYEIRSQFLLNKIKDKIEMDNILVLFFEDYETYPHVKTYRGSLDEKITRSENKYDGGDNVQKTIVEFINEHLVDGGTVHIDYSSMPRNWYYQLPLNTELLKHRVNYWYVSGKYPMSYEVYPSAGIEGYSVIGRPSLRMKHKRLHVIGLGYDTVRTKALISILDPDMYSVCAAFETSNQEISDNLHLANSQIISQAISKVSLQMDDFSFMVAKLCEIAIEFLPLGDVVFVPDGPKPLIMAMSLVPLILKREGISCLHVSRNNQCYEPVMVEASNTILGFEVKEYF